MYTVGVLLPRKIDFTQQGSLGTSAEFSFHMLDLALSGLVVGGLSSVNFVDFSLLVLALPCPWAWIQWTAVY